LIDRLGRKVIQIMGFSILTLLFLILGFAYNQIRCYSMWLFITIFLLAQFVSCAGPNTTVFVIPAEVYPTQIRTTLYGISAAIGKLGAVVAEGHIIFYFIFFVCFNLNGFFLNLINIVGFFQLKNIDGITNKGLPLILQIFAGFMLLGGLFSFLLPETKGKSLEELSSVEPDSSHFNSIEMVENLKLK
jgi:PHS family inorganic phosphate transporter-like MFS transporter